MFLPEFRIGGMENAGCVTDDAAAAASAEILTSGTRAIELDDLEEEEGRRTHLGPSGAGS